MACFTAAFYLPFGQEEAVFYPLGIYLPTVDKKAENRMRIL